MTDEIIQKEEVVVETPNEPISEPETVISPEPPTAQIPVNEPLPSPIEIEAEPIVKTIPTETKPAEPEIQSEPTPEPIPEIVKEEVKPEISEPVSEPIQTSQIPVNEPLAPEPEIKTEPKPVEQIPETKPESKPIPEIIPAVAIISKSKSLARELLVKARNMIQFRKRKKLDKIMTLFVKQTKITNDEVEKFMHVSDATAGRYLSQLEKENKIKQTGKTGKSVFYSKL